MKRVIIVLLLLPPLFVGCAQFEFPAGGRSGPENSLMGQKPAMSTTLATHEVRIITKVTDFNNKPLPGVRVSAETTLGEVVNAVTDKNGRVRLPLVLSANESVNFTVSSSMGSADQVVKPALVVGAEWEMHFRFKPGKMELVSQRSKEEEF